MLRITLLLTFLLIGQSAPAQPPNVVLIIADDQAWTDFGFMGHPTIRTPHIDRLAAQGAVFPRGYVTAPLCRPSLASMITGLHPHQHGITGNDPPRGTPRARMLDLIDRVDTLPKLLAEQGYRSLQTGKWWEGDYRNGGFTDGMTHGDPKRRGRHGDDGLRIGRETMQPIGDFLDRCGDDPFFLWYAPFLPHRPHNPPERILEKYHTADRSEHVARYYAMCEWFDESCGQLLDLLDKRGKTANTLVVFVVDNGWIQRPDGQGFAERSKRSPYEGGVRTPVILHWPGKIQAGRHDAVISTVDLAPTILRASGASVPEALPGVDLMPLCAGAEPKREAVFGAAFTHDVADLRVPHESLVSRFVVGDRFKLIEHRDPDAKTELYDLIADPHEQENRAATEAKRETELRARLERWWPARPARPDEPERRPNLLLIVTDDQRVDALGVAGHPFLQTPNLDDLARSGVRFENAFVTTSICAASRATILTGLHRRTHGYTFGTPPLAEGLVAQSYPTLLRDAGYRTGFVGKVGVRLPAKAPERLFDWYRPLTPPYLKAKDPSVPHLTDRIGEQAIGFLRDAKPDQPFCLSVSFNAPHAEDSNPRQYVWPPELDGLYDDQPIPPPTNAEPAFFDAQPEFLRRSLNRIRWGWRFDTEAKRVAMTRGYYRMITGVDRAVGRIIDELERLDLADETVIVFTSDNGYFLGERGFAGKWTIHEPSIRVPLIVCDPRTPEPRRGESRQAMVLNVDLMPTLLDLAGVPIPSTCQGSSLVPLLNAEPDRWRHDMFYEHLFDHADIPKSEGVRGARFKYVRYFQQDPLFEELYDLVADPLEISNLAGDPEHAKLLSELRTRCDELRDRYGGRYERTERRR